MFVNNASRFSLGTKLIWFILISVFATDTRPTRCKVVNAEESCQRDWKQYLRAGTMCAEECCSLSSLSTSMAWSPASFFKAVPTSTLLSPESSPYHPGSINESLFPRVSNPNETGLTGFSRPSLSTQTSSMLGSRSQEWRQEIISWATKCVSFTNADFLWVCSEDDFCGDPLLVCCGAEGLRRFPPTAIFEASGFPEGLASKKNHIISQCYQKVKPVIQELKWFSDDGQRW